MDRSRRKEINEERKNQYTQALRALAEESGLLRMAGQAAAQRGGRVDQELVCYLDYGMSSSCLQQALPDPKHGELRASHLAIRIVWEEGGAPRVAEARVHKNGQVTFHNNILPVFPFLWRSSPHLLEKMLNSALSQPRILPVEPAAKPEKPAAQ